MRMDAFFPDVPGKGEAARRRLLEAALTVFGEKGLKGATVRDIAALAGQNVAAIKYYFGGKEEMYTAVVEGIVRELRHRMGDNLQEIQTFRREGTNDSERALALLQNFLSSIYLRLLSKDDVMQMGRVVIREQTQPSAAFEVLYEKAFREVHESLCYLVGAVLRKPAQEEEVIIRTHSLLGQVWFFAIGRETILRRLRWKTLDGTKAEVVAGVLRENIALLLMGARDRKKEGRKSRS